MIPRVGGIIEDETGWWIITEVAVEDGGVWVMDKHGNEQFQTFETLGPVAYDDDA